MAPAPNPVQIQFQGHPRPSPRQHRLDRIWRLLAVAAPHLAALGGDAFRPRPTSVHAQVSLLSWGILNFFWIALLRASGIIGRAVAHVGGGAGPGCRGSSNDIVQMTANFVDLMVIDRDTAAFLLRSSPICAGPWIGARAAQSFP